MQQSDFEKVLADTLAARGRSARTQETYTLMLRLFARYLGARMSARPSTPLFPRTSKRTSVIWSRRTGLLVLQPIYVCLAVLLP